MQRNTYILVLRQIVYVCADCLLRIHCFCISPPLLFLSLLPLDFDFPRIDSINSHIRSANLSVGFKYLPKNRYYFISSS